MAHTKFAFSMIYAVTLLMNIYAVSAMEMIGVDASVTSIGSESLTTSSLSFISGTLVSSIGLSVSVSVWAPSATTTGLSSLIYSTRPAASGFWTGPDPFSFVPPTYLTSVRSSLTSIDKSTDILSVAASSSSNAEASTVTDTSSTDTTTKTEGNPTTVSTAAISVSTHTDTVTPGPAYTTESVTSTSITSEETSTSTSTLQADGSHISATSWLGWVLLVLTQHLL